MTSRPNPHEPLAVSRTYTATGITLKAMPMGESDRLLTILTPEWGLVRAIAPGARKHNSRLAGRSSLFVINQLLLSRGKSLDRIAQAETLYSFPGLAKDLGKLTAGQYLAEIVLYQGLSDQPQADLYHLLQEHLERLEASPADEVLAHLTQAIFHLLSLAGLSPQVHQCCLDRTPVQPDLRDTRWRVGFSPVAGGMVQAQGPNAQGPNAQGPNAQGPNAQVSKATKKIPDPRSRLLSLNALETAVFQRLAEPTLPDLGDILEKAALVPEQAAALRAPWPTIEQALRQYVEYHLDRTILSAGLIDSYFSAVPPTGTFTSSPSR